MSEDIVALLDRMIDRKTRHDYGIGDWWNMGGATYAEISRLREELAATQRALLSFADDYYEKIWYPELGTEPDTSIRGEVVKAAREAQKG